MCSRGNAAGVGGVIMGDVIDISSRLPLRALPEIDPDTEITITLTVGTADAIMRLIWLRADDYFEDDDTPVLEDFYMDLQSEIWGEDEC